MNDELQKQLAEVVRKGLEVAEKTGEFVMDQAPEILNEFYRWRIVDSIFGIVIGVLVFLTVRYAPMLFIKRKEKDHGKYGYSSDVEFFGRYGEESSFVSWMLFGMGSIFSVLTICINLHTLLYISVAPKLYLINYFLK